MIVIEHTVLKSYAYVIMQIARVIQIVFEYVYSRNQKYKELIQINLFEMKTN